MAGAAIAACCYLAETSQDAYTPNTWSLAPMASVGVAMEDDEKDEFTAVRRRVVTGGPKTIKKAEAMDRVLSHYGQ